MKSYKVSHWNGRKKISTVEKDKLMKSQLRKKVPFNRNPHISESHCSAKKFYQKKYETKRDRFPVFRNCKRWPRKLYQINTQTSTTSNYSIAKRLTVPMRWIKENEKRKLFNCLVNGINQQWNREGESIWNGIVFKFNKSKSENNANLKRNKLSYFGYSLMYTRAFALSMHSWPSCEFISIWKIKTHQAKGSKSHLCSRP